MADYVGRIEAVKRAICGLGPMRPGTLTKQAHRAGGEAYYQASYTFRRKGHTDYVRAGDYPRVREEVANYGRFRKLCDRLVELSIAWSKSKNTPRQKASRRRTARARSGGGPAAS